MILHIELRTSHYQIAKLSNQEIIDVVVSDGKQTIIFVLKQNLHH